MKYKIYQNFKEQIVVGVGEIGSSLKEVLEEGGKEFGYDIHSYDVKSGKAPQETTYDVLHVCFPFYEQDAFVSDVINYVQKFRPELTIIHSTVKVGTTEKINNKLEQLNLPKNCVHSPIRGKHPNLKQSIKTFMKFVGGENVQAVDRAIELLTSCNITCYKCTNSKTSELLKILSTTKYGWDIVFMKEVKKLCEDYGTSFIEAYHASNLSYNKGYLEMGEKKFLRPNLTYVPGSIGGHCVIPNCKLLESDITKFILDKNETYA